MRKDSCSFAEGGWGVGVKAADLFTAMSHMLQKRFYSKTTKEQCDYYSKGHGL